MKVEIELDDAFVKKVEEELDIDVKVLLKEFASQVLKGLVEAATVMKAVPITDEMLRQYGIQVGSDVFKRARRKEKGEM